MAEQIFKTLGAEKEGTPGSWDNGIRYTGKFLSQIVGAKEGSYEIQNGSGLGMDNRVSADLLIRVLRYMNDNPALKNAFLASLPVMGLDGTLRNRHKHSDASNRIMAKTGFINNVTTLSV
ncbi:MAG: D-alanyl-D-alanine carboxypeptidase DacC [Syntrophus sp. SKADARSKE-3]|nr:D-alanyl-D-alanine carboxypeptidase DacC [Syntrophus sp. SKADARSKE-3]